MSNNLGFAASNNFCPLGGNCDRIYCYYDHPIDAAKRSQTGRPEPVIVQEDNTDDLDYIGYVGTSSTTPHMPSYSGSALFNSQLLNDSTSFSQYFPSYPSLYAPEDPMLQGAGCASNTSVPAYSSIYTPSYQQSGPLLSQLSYGTDTAVDGPVYPPASVRATIPPLVTTNTAHRTPAEVCAASFGAFHGPTVVAKELATKKAAQAYQPTIPQSNTTTATFQQAVSAADANRMSPTIMQITEEDPQPYTAPAVVTAVESVKNDDSITRKRDHATALKSSLSTSLPPRKRPTAGVPAYVPTPIAELERQKQAVKQKEQKRANLIPRNRSPCADDFSIIDRPTLPIDLANDEILNLQKRAPVQPAVVAKSKPKAAKQPTKDAKISASSSFSVSNRILPPPKKVQTTISKPLSVGTPKLDATSSKSDAKPLKSILKSSIPKSGTSIGGVDKSSDKGMVNTTVPLPTTKIYDMESALVCGPPQRRLKGSSAIFDRFKTAPIAEIDKKPGAASSPAKQIDLNAKRNRLGHLNETAKALANLDKQIAAKERDLRDMISGQSTSKTPKQKTVSHDKRPGEAEMNTTADQFSIDTFLDELDGINKNIKSSDESNDSVVFCAETKNSNVIQGSSESEKPSLVRAVQRTTTTTTQVTKTTTLKAPLRKKPPTAVEQMKNRFALDVVKPTTTGSADQKQDYGFAKGESRKARIGTFITSSSGRKLAPLDIYDKKIAYSLRSKYLQKVFDEFKKIATNDDEAINMAVREEKAILDKISTNTAYAAAIANSVKRIREAASSGSSAADRTGISHMDVLAGRQAGTFTVGVKGLRSSNGHISEADFYAKISKKYLLSAAQMWENGYPRWSRDVPSSADSAPRLVEIQPHVPISIKHGYVDDSMLTRVCNRCGTEYRLTKDGEYTAPDNTCIYHWGKAWKKRINGALDSRYTCCDQDLNVKGCVIGELHVTETKRASTLADYAETPRPFGVGDPRSRKVYALDCEMVYSVWGPVLARVSIVDVLDELVLDEIVRPEHKVVDPNTRFSGLTIEHLESAKCTFHEVRERVFELVNRDTILIGHSLESDLKAMRIVHPKVVDTSVVFPHRLGPPKKRALKTIACEVLQKIIQEDVSGHDSKEDASACMKIMLHKVEKMD